VQRLEIQLIGVFMATNFIVGRWTASAMAAGWWRSLFCD
jgi:hypothetical protein